MTPEVIELGPTAYYIHREGEAYRYLHKNFTWHTACGSENLFKTKEEADQHLKRYNQMESNFKIKIKSPEHSKAVQKRLFELGYSWSLQEKSFKYTDKKYLFADECIVDKTKRLSYSSQEGDWKDPANGLEKTLDDLYNMNSPIKVKLNDKYTAEVNKEGVVVGCQTFSHDVILELAEKIKGSK